MEYLKFIRKQKIAITVSILLILFSSAMHAYSQTVSSIGDSMHVVNDLTVNGNVGIGTTSPTVNLEVLGNQALHGNLKIDNLSKIKLGSTGDIWISEGNTGLDALLFNYTQGTNWTRVKIGDSTTDEKLGIYTASDSAEQYGSSGWNNLVSVDNSGNMSVNGVISADGFELQGSLINDLEMVRLNFIDDACIDVVQQLKNRGYDRCMYIVDSGSGYNRWNSQPDCSASNTTEPDLW